MTIRREKKDSANDRLQQVAMMLARQCVSISAIWFILRLLILSLIVTMIDFLKVICVSNLTALHTSVRFDTGWATKK